MRLKQKVSNLSDTLVFYDVNPLSLSVVTIQNVMYHVRTHVPETDLKVVTTARKDMCGTIPRDV